MANVLDWLLILGFGAWAYMVAKKKRRDEVGWTIVAAIAFYLPGYAVQEIVFPKLAPGFGWPETWQKPAGFLVGSIAALLVDLYLTLFAKLLPEPIVPEGEAQPVPRGDGTLEPPPDEEGAAPPATIAEPGAQDAAPRVSYRALAAQFWPTLVALGALGVTFLPWKALCGTLGVDCELADPLAGTRYFVFPAIVGTAFWRWRGRFIEGLIAAVLATVFVPSFQWMVWRWGRGSSYYSHGYLIPFVVAWLIWMNRRRLATLQAKDDLRGIGLIVLVAGLLLLLMGTFIRAFSVQGVSFVVLLCGLVFFLAGRAISRILLFPLLFVITMVPMPMHVVEKLTFRLKMFASTASVWLVDALRAVGVHDHMVIKDGSYIRWEVGEKMDHIIVGDVCSGLRSLIALIAFGALFAYIAKLSLFRKTILFGAAVPISVLANMWRIVTLTFIACRWGSESAHGWVHDVTGYGIFAVAFVLFFTFERVLRKFEPDLARTDAPAGRDPAAT